MSLDFVYTAVSWVLLRWHQLFSVLGMNPNGGLTWTLSIALLVITARLGLFRLFVKQLQYMRNLQKMQPKIAKLREKYRNDRAELNRQMIKLQQQEGFNPLSGWLPIFLQIPIFLGLYHVVRHLSAAASQNYQLTHPDRLTLYTFTKHETLSAAHAKLFGHVPLAASFHDSTHTIVSPRCARGHHGQSAANDDVHHPARCARVRAAVRLSARRADLLAHEQYMVPRPAGLRHPKPPANRRVGSLSRPSARPTRRRWGRPERQLPHRRAGRRASCTPESTIRSGRSAQAPAP